MMKRVLFPIVVLSFIPVLFIVRPIWAAMRSVPPKIISAGYRHTLTLKPDGTLWASGSNQYGQLGDGTNISRQTPVQVGSSNSYSGTCWVMVSAGYYHSLALKSDGTLWAWGRNYYGQLGNGDGTYADKNLPVPVGSDHDWVMVSAGGEHSLALKRDGTLWAWGRNDYGQLGDGSNTIRNTPVQVLLVSMNNMWVMVSAGGYHSLALRSDGSLWAWGENTNGQLGDLSNTNRNTPVLVDMGNNMWIMVSAGYHHTLALRPDGTLWAWGQNSYGQLGDSSNTDKNAPVPVGSGSSWVMASAGYDHSLALKPDGTLWAWGHNSYGGLGDSSNTDRNTPVPVGSDNNWVMVSARGLHTLALKSDGTLWAWGYNGYGQLGDSSNTNKNAPVHVGSDRSWVKVSAGYYHTLALKSDGTLWAWGSNSHGQLGDGTNTDKNTPVQVGSDNRWVMASAGETHSIALKSDGTLWAWGENVYGELGDSSNTDKNTPVQVGSDNRWVMVSAGWAYSLALKSDGSLWAWGDNGYGQLGDGTNTDRNSPVMVAGSWGWVMVSAGWRHTLALKDDGSLWTWGDNGYGQLGDGTNTNRNTPGKLGGTNYYPSDNMWVMVSAGRAHSLALKSDGTLWAWGYNHFGQLGNGTNTDSNRPVQVNGGNWWVMVSAGDFHTLALKSNGSLWAWGYNYEGQLGDGTNTNKNDAAAGQVGLDNRWVMLSAGFRHSLALKSDGTLWTCGINSYGELGDGTYTNRNTPVPIFKKGDFDGDWRTDILWRNGSTGQNAVWYMNGATFSSYAGIMDVGDCNWEIVGPK